MRVSPVALGLAALAASRVALAEPQGAPPSAAPPAGTTDAPSAGPAPTPPATTPSTSLAAPPPAAAPSTSSTAAPSTSSTATPLTAAPSPPTATPSAGLTARPPSAAPSPPVPPSAGPAASRADDAALDAIADAAAADPNAPQERAAAELRELMRPPGATYHVLGTLFFGDGLRFNNPYRLKTQLGESARSVSVTAPYADLGVALAVGDAFGFQHGAALNLSLSMSGVTEVLLAPTYTVTYRGASHRFLGFGRLGPAIALMPDVNVGGELGAGGAVFLTARTAVTAEIVGDLFYGAATKEAGFPVYPVLSLQLGLLLDHEVLP